jgi:hypothetical protein
VGRSRRGFSLCRRIRVSQNDVVAVACTRGERVRTSGAAGVDEKERGDGQHGEEEQQQKNGQSPLACELASRTAQCVTTVLHEGGEGSQARIGVQASCLLAVCYNLSFFYFSSA